MRSVIWVIPAIVSHWTSSSLWMSALTLCPEIDEPELFRGTFRDVRVEERADLGHQRVGFGKSVHA